MSLLTYYIYIGTMLKDINKRLAHEVEMRGENDIWFKIVI